MNACSFSTQPNQHNITTTRNYSEDLSAIKSSLIEQGYAEQGEVIVSRSIIGVNIPNISSRNLSANSSSVMQNSFAPLLGYIPPSKSFTVEEATAWIKIDRRAQELHVMRGEKSVFTASTQGVLELEKGSYTVESKETNPLWRASRNYFLSRNLHVPAENESSILRRGALGSLALRLPNQQFVHSAKHFSQEVGGLRLKESDMKKVYSLIDPGTKIVIAK